MILSLISLISGIIGIISFITWDKTDKLKGFIVLMLMIICFLTGNLAFEKRNPQIIEKTIHIKEKAKSSSPVTNNKKQQVNLFYIIEENFKKTDKVKYYSEHGYEYASNSKISRFINKGKNYVVNSFLYDFLQVDKEYYDSEMKIITDFLHNVNKDKDHKQFDIFKYLYDHLDRSPRNLRKLYYEFKPAIIKNMDANTFRESGLKDICENLLKYKNICNLDYYHSDPYGLLEKDYSRYIYYKSIWDDRFRERNANAIEEIIKDLLLTYYPNLDIIMLTEEILLEENEKIKKEMEMEMEMEMEKIVTMTKRKKPRKKKESIIDRIINKRK